MADHRHTTIQSVVPCEQANNYECGLAALQTILLTLGRATSRAELLPLLQPDPHGGIPPARLKSALASLAVKYTESHLNSQHDLEAAINSRSLCLVAYQAWGGASEIMNLDAGHYSVVYGHDRTHFYLADPSIHPTIKRPHRQALRKIRKDIFMPRWQDNDMDNNKYDQWMLCVPTGQFI